VAQVGKCLNVSRAEPYRFAVGRDSRGALTELTQRTSKIAQYLRIIGPQLERVSIPTQSVSRLTELQKCIAEVVVRITTGRVDAQSFLVQDYRLAQTTDRALDIGGIDEGVWVSWLQSKRLTQACQSFLPLTAQP